MRVISPISPVSRSTTAAIEMSMLPRSIWSGWAKVTRAWSCSSNSPCLATATCQALEISPPSDTATPCAAPPARVRPIVPLTESASPFDTA